MLYNLGGKLFSFSSQGEQQPDEDCVAGLAEEGVRDPAFEALEEDAEVFNDDSIICERVSRGKRGKKKKVAKGVSEGL